MEIIFMRRSRFRQTLKVEEGKESQTQRWGQLGGEKDPTKGTKTTTTNTHTG